MLNESGDVTLDQQFLGRELLSHLKDAHKMC